MNLKPALWTLFAATSVAHADAPQRQELADAWWTGPMLANSASTLPQGHWLLEPYLYDVRGSGAFDRNGDRHKTKRSHGYGSLTYMTYGVTDHFSLSLIPTFGYNDPGDGLSSSGIGVGDLAVHAQYRLTQFQPGSAMPTISLAVQQTLPTGKYDRLDRASDGFGAGADTTMFGIYSQTYFWMPNGRILRMRLNFTKSFSNRVDLADASVYGTEDGFRGSARPGASFVANAAWEYSLTKHWVLALDAVWRHTNNTRVRGRNAPDASETVFDSGSSRSLALAPAVEYNFNANVGVLFGVRTIVAGRNASAHVTPAIAVNIVR